MRLVYHIHCSMVYCLFTEQHRVIKERERASEAQLAGDLWRMRDPLTFSMFLVCMLACNTVSCILYKYQKTISPVNQNIINKLCLFCIFCLNSINSSQVLAVTEHVF